MLVTTFDGGKHIVNALHVFPDQIKEIMVTNVGPLLFDRRQNAPVPALDQPQLADSLLTM
jgi:hypothetical protein